MMSQKLWRGAMLPVAIIAISAASAQDTQPPLDSSAIQNQDFVVDRSDRMTIPVRVNDSEPMPFVIDTGAERTVIAHDLAQRLALKSGRQLTLATVTGPTRVQSYLIPRLRTDTVNVEGLEAPGLERRNLGAYGLLGIDSLENHKILLDFQGNKMDVLPSPAKKAKKAAIDRGMIVVTATRRAGRMILSSAHIGNVKIDVIVDTGAQSSMGNFALRRKLRAENRLLAFMPVKIRSVTGDILAGDYTQIKTISIGGMQINGLPVTFADNYAFEALDLEKKPAILLGMDAMQLFDRVMIDFGNRKVGFDLPRSAGYRDFLRTSDLESTGSIFK